MCPAFRQKPSRKSDGNQNELKWLETEQMTPKNQSTEIIAIEMAFNAENYKQTVSLEHKCKQKNTLSASRAY